MKTAVDAAPGMHPKLRSKYECRLSAAELKIMAFESFDLISSQCTLLRVHFSELSSHWRGFFVDQSFTFQAPRINLHQITKSPGLLNCSRFSPHAFHLDQKVEVFAAEGSPGHQIRRSPGQLKFSPSLFKLRGSICTKSPSHLDC